MDQNSFSQLSQNPDGIIINQPKDGNFPDGPQDLILVFSSIFSLFEGKTNIIVDFKRIATFALFADLLGNNSLSSIVDSVRSSEQDLEYSLNSNDLRLIPVQILKRNSTFSLFLGVKDYSVNGYFLACLSDKISQLIKENPAKNNFTITLPDDVDQKEFCSID